MSEARLIKVSDLTRMLRTRIFDYAEQSRKYFKDMGTPVTCRPGCHHCCGSKIVVDAGTGAAIYLQLRPRWTRQLEAKLVAADREMTAKSHADYFGTPCVFLKGGRCTIYPVRPFACATAFSISDPEECRVGDNRSHVHVHEPAATRHVAAVQEALMEGTGETEVWLMTLPGAVLYGRAMMHELPRPDVHRIRWGSWVDRGEHLEDVFDRVCHSALSDSVSEK